MVTQRPDVSVPSAEDFVITGRFQNTFRHEIFRVLFALTIASKMFCGTFL
jgi:hypothetical protein